MDEDKEIERKRKREMLLYLWSRWTVGPWYSNVPRKPLEKQEEKNIIIIYDY